MRKLSLLVLLTLFSALVLSCSSGSSAAGPPSAGAAAVSAASPTPSPTTAAAGSAAKTLSSMPSPTAPPTASPTATPMPSPVKTGPGNVPQVDALAVVVVDEASGTILYERNAHERVAPASLTKIATAIVALERGRLRDVVKVNYDATGLEDSTLMGVNPRDEVTLEDLLYGIMLPSGNEASLAIANYIAGSERAFVDLMNARVKELGLQDTRFANPHGLDAPQHYSSAYDITMLARYGMMNLPEFAPLAGAKKWTIQGRSPDGSPKIWEIYNLNRFLLNYEGADGVKIGYTDAAGRTIVASATRGGHRVYVGLMGCSDIVGDSRPLFDYVFSNYTWP